MGNVMMETGLYVAKMEEVTPSLLSARYKPNPFVQPIFQAEAWLWPLKVMLETRKTKEPN